MEAAGGKCLPLQVDLREDNQLIKAVDETVKQFGGLDVLINNASAINLSGTEDLDMKRYDLMHSINTRGTFLASKFAIPHLKKASNPHILNLSPPLAMNSIWFKNHVAYTMAKYGMSMCVLGMAEELKSAGIAVNALWPKSAIWTAAMAMLAGGEAASKQCRKPDIMADSAYGILSKDSKAFTGNFLVDELFLKQEGITDMNQYAVSPGSKLIPDFFLPEDVLKSLENDPNFDAALLGQQTGSQEQQQSAPASEESGAPKATGPTAEIFQEIQSAITDDLKKELNATIAFVISGQNWYVDANASRPLKIDNATTPNAEVTLITDETTFVKLAQGKTKATSAFMGGKLKVKGNISIAMKMEKMFKRLKKN